MLEPLIGRLKWESKGEGIRLVIPSRFRWWSLVSGVWLLMLPHFAYEVFWKSEHTGVMTPRSFFPEWIGLLLFIGWIALFRTHKCVVTLASTEMRVEKRSLGLRLRDGTSATSQLSDLRFIPSRYGITVDDQSRIQFRRGGKICSFGIGIEEVEADAAIAKMREIYAFPDHPLKEPTAGSIATS